MKWLKRWIHRAVHEFETTPEGHGPPTTVHDVLRQMSNSMATIYRIDNGFIMTINLNSATHLGQRGACVYAKDASELAEKVIAHETAFKLGVGGGGLSGQTPDHGPAKAAFQPQLHSKQILKTYQDLKGMKYV